MERSYIRSFFINSKMEDRYQRAIDYLFNAAPLFQHLGAGAYKPGLQTTKELDAHFGHPHCHYKTIHIAGTNGKGSTAHTIAAILQSAGYRVGLYTSPHLVDFRERIRVNGKMISKARVVRFVEEEKSFFEPLQPSFFEITTSLALLYFAEQKVDVAVIEVGLGGRLDCTNIIHPELCVITNISFDHTSFLGNTLAEIASEKAGIIKKDVPVVIGETLPETKPVFLDTAEKIGAPIYFAEEDDLLFSISESRKGFEYSTKNWGTFFGELSGSCQQKNTNTILSALNHLKGFDISAENIHEGFGRVMELTGLAGRWQTISVQPLTICDTGHNAGGWQYLSKQLAALSKERHLHVVFGMANDKDIDSVLSNLPKNATYYFTQASVQRALPFDNLLDKAQRLGLTGTGYATVGEAYDTARDLAEENDAIFVGGSSFVVADFLEHINS